MNEGFDASRVHERQLGDVETDDTAVLDRTFERKGKGGCAGEVELAAQVQEPGRGDVHAEGRTIRGRVGGLLLRHRRGLRSRRRAGRRHRFRSDGTSIPQFGHTIARRRTRTSGSPGRVSRSVTRWSPRRRRNWCGIGHNGGEPGTRVVLVLADRFPHH